VEVAVVVLLEVGRGERVTWEGLRRDTKVGEKLSDDRLVVIAVCCSLLRGGSSSLFTLLGFFGSLNCDRLLDILSRWKPSNNALSGSAVN
jgi:hypothetical protein